jgi:pyrroloquinoline quinone biosynthesis protein E
LFSRGILGGDARGALQAALAQKTKPAPRALHIDITLECPFACALCYKREDETIANPHLPDEVFRRLIAEAETLGVFQVSLGGGEPLCHPRLPELVRAVARTEMAVSITTSGWGLADGGALARLVDAGINHIQVSLNGADPATNGRSRDGFGVTLRALERLAESRLSFGINWVARRDNLDGFEAMADLARRLGADNINVLRYKPSPTEDYPTQALDADGFHRLAEKLCAVKGIHLKLDSAYSNLLLFLNAGRANPENSACGAGRSFVAVTHQGRFKPCSHLDLARETDGIEDYYSSDALRQFRDTPVTGGDCGDCGYIKLCGGCRAICEKAGNGLFAGETGCPACSRS